jgi:hypothetical protein
MADQHSSILCTSVENSCRSTHQITIQIAIFSVGLFVVMESIPVAPWQTAIVRYRHSSLAAVAVEKLSHSAEPSDEWQAVKLTFE